MACSRHHYKTARRLLLPLAEQGDVSAQMTLFEIHYLGDGGHVDKSRAAYWFEQVVTQAENGCGEAQWALYQHYLADGDIAAREFAVPWDSEISTQWLMAAANSGYAEAMFELSMKYRTGCEGKDGRRLIEVDLTSSDFWLDRAVAEQYPDALVFKSFFYFENGQPTDKAKVLLKAAADLGSLEATEYLT